MARAKTGERQQPRGNGWGGDAPRTRRSGTDGPKTARPPQRLVRYESATRGVRRVEPPKRGLKATAGASELVERLFDDRPTKRRRKSRSWLRTVRELEDATRAADSPTAIEALWGPELLGAVHQAAADLAERVAEHAGTAEDVRTDPTPVEVPIEAAPAVERPEPPALAAEAAPLPSPEPGPAHGTDRTSEFDRSVLDGGGSALEVFGFDSFGPIEPPDRVDAAEQDAAAAGVSELDSGEHQLPSVDPTAEAATVSPPCAGVVGEFESMRGELGGLRQSVDAGRARLENVAEAVAGVADRVGDAARPAQSPPPVDELVDSARSLRTQQLLSAAAVLLLCWAVVFWVKTGDLRLTLGALVVANLAATGLLLTTRRRPNSNA